MYCSKNRAHEGCIWSKFFGDMLMDFSSEVVFSNRLAIVAGLTVAGSENISGDVYAQIISKGKLDPNN